MLKKLSYLAIVSLLVSTSAHTSPTDPYRDRTTRAATQRRVYVFILDRVTWQDLEAQRQRGGAFRKLIEQGAVAALNTQTAGGISSAGAALTLSAGMKAQGDEEAGEVCNVDEPMDLESGTGADVFTRRTGFPLAGHRIVATRIGFIHQRNAFLHGRSQIGQLGSLLEKRGLKTAVLGCSDISPQGKAVLQYKPPTGVAQTNAVTRYRSPALIAIDAQGRIGYGDVSPAVLAPDATAPFGWITHREVVLSHLDRLSARSDLYLTVIDFGDTFRANECSAWVEADVAAKQRQAALLRADELLRGILARMSPEKDRLYVLPLSPPRANAYDLCPLIVYGKGCPRHSLLISSSSRRQVVTLADLTLSILQFAQVNLPSTLRGNRIHPFSDLRAWQRVGKLIHECAVVDGHLRTPSLTALGLLEAALLLWAFFATLSARPAPDQSGARGDAQRYQIEGVLSFFLLFLLIAPLLLFWGTPMFFSTRNTLSGIAVLVGACAFMTALLHNAFQSRWSVVVLVSAATAVSIGFDLFTGSNISFNSILGYSPFIGARYYGSGNECQAILMGSLLVCVGAALSCFGEKSASIPISWGNLLLVTCVFAPCLYLIGYPHYGSDFGGTIAAALGFGVALFRLRGIQLRKGQWIGLSLLVVFLLTFYTWVDLRHPSEESHLGRLIMDIKTHGSQTFFDTVWRKLEVLGRSFRHAHWDIALAAILLMLAFIPRMRKVGRLPVLNRYPAYSACLAALVYGGVFAFLLNDSGAVIPALAALYGFASLFYLNNA